MSQKQIPINRTGVHRATKPSRARILLLAMSVGWGGFLFGYECILGGLLLDLPQFRLRYGSPQLPSLEFGWSHSLRGIFISILSLGTVLGSSLACVFADR